MPKIPNLPQNIMPANPLKAALLVQRRQIGLWSALCSNIVAEVIGYAGFDWIVVDTEHAPSAPLDVLAQLQALATGTAEPVVRVAWNDAVLLKGLLDIGARSFLIPFVQNAEEARAAVSATRYPPQGIRGVSVSHRANRFGRVPNYLHTASEQMCVLVQLETAVALASWPRSRPTPAAISRWASPSLPSAATSACSRTAAPPSSTACARQSANRRPCARFNFNKLRNKEHE